MVYVITVEIGAVRVRVGGRVGVGRLARWTFEKAVLERLGRVDAELGVVVEHAHDDLLEFEIVLERVAGLVEAARLRPARLRAEDVAEAPGAGQLVLFALFEPFDLPCAVREAVEVALGLAALFKHMNWRYAEHLDYFVHLVVFVVAVE